MAVTTKKIDKDLQGEAFTDERLRAPGAGSVPLEHDYFQSQTLVIRDAAGGGGTLLAQGVDYTVDDEVAALSAEATSAQATTINVYNKVTITNAAFQGVELFVTGNYIGDSVEGQDVWDRPIREQLEAITDNPVDQTDHLLPSGILIPLQTPDCVASDSRRPDPDLSVVPFYPRVRIQGEENQSNPLCLWNPGGVTENDYQDFELSKDPTGEGRPAMGFFERAENLIVDPEDMDALGGGIWATLDLDTTTLLEDTFEGSQFTEIAGDGTGGDNEVRQFISSTPHAAGGTSRFDSAGRKIVSVVLKQGTSPTATVELIDNTAAAARVDADITFSTKAVTMNTGTKTRSTWYTDHNGVDIVELVFLSTSITAANDHSLEIVIGQGTTQTLFATRAMVLDVEEVERPYVATTRPQSKATYRWGWANQGTIEFWLRPMFEIDVGEDVAIWSSRLAGTTSDYMVFLYAEGHDKFIFKGVDSAGVDEKHEATDLAYTLNSQLQVWQHFKMTWDTATDTMALYVDGSVQSTTPTDLGDGILNADFTRRNRLRIGEDDPDTPLAASSLLVDFRYQAVVDATTLHYAIGRPYYQNAEWKGKDVGYRRDKHGHVYSRPRVVGG